jgi:hypothetical protein
MNNRNALGKTVQNTRPESRFPQQPQPITKRHIRHMETGNQWAVSKSGQIFPAGRKLIFIMAKAIHRSPAEENHRYQPKKQDYSGGFTPQMWVGFGIWIYLGDNWPHAPFLDLS